MQDSSQPQKAPRLSRREALRRALLGGVAVGTAAALPQAGAASPPEAPASFIPENDYPFFGAPPEAE